MWKAPGIFANDDDAHGAADHVGAHRSVLLAMSPYIRKNCI